jgi:hypothetical protein
MATPHLGRIAAEAPAPGGGRGGQTLRDPESWARPWHGCRSWFRGEVLPSENAAVQGGSRRWVGVAGTCLLLHI